MSHQPVRDFWSTSTVRDWANDISSSSTAVYGATVWYLSISITIRIINSPALNIELPTMLLSYLIIPLTQGRDSNFFLCFAVQWIQIATRDPTLLSFLCDEPPSFLERERERENRRKRNTKEREWGEGGTCLMYFYCKIINGKGKQSQSYCAHIHSIH